VSEVWRSDDKTSLRVSKLIVFCYDKSAVKRYWEIIADNLKKAGWSLGWVSAVDAEGRTIWIADAHRGDGQRFVVHTEEKVTAMLELERAICLHLLSEQL
jgi:hypothetical protein